jgi:hypothetical protein
MKQSAFRFLLLLLLGAKMPAVCAAQASSESTAPLSSSRNIRPAMILWGGGAAGLLETITPAALGNRKTWRITHYAQDPTETKINDYDLYDLDQETLAPLRSVRNTEDYQLELTFDEKEVTLRKSGSNNTTMEHIPLTSPVQAEGPGLDVFVAGLPLRTGYRIRYAMVDRWSGHEKSRLKTVTLAVLKRSTEDTSLGRREIYEILIQPEDYSFEIRERVLAGGPHYPVRVEYTRAGKTYPASEVISLMNCSTFSP